MSLVICPECKNEVSEYTESCPKCGFPIQEYIRKHELSDFQKVFICPKCGNYELYFDFNPNAPKHLVCEFCNTPFIQTDLDTNEFERQSLQEWRNGNKSFEADVAKKYGNDMFDEQAYQNRENILAQQKRNKHQQQSTQKNIPKCPTCGSTNIRKISASKKMAGAIGFGLFSKTARSQFECLDCKYKW